MMCGRKFKVKKVFCNVFDFGIIRIFLYNVIVWRKSSVLEEVF